MCLKLVSVHPSKWQRCLSGRCYSAGVHLRFQRHDLDKLFLREVDSPVVYFGPYLDLVFGLTQRQALRQVVRAGCTCSVTTYSSFVSWRGGLLQAECLWDVHRTECSGAVAFSQAEHQGRSGYAIVFSQPAEVLWHDLEEARPPFYPSRCPELPL